MRGRRGRPWANYYTFRETLTLSVTKFDLFEDALCQLVYMYLLLTNSILLTGCVMVIIRIVQNAYRCF